MFFIIIENIIIECSFTILNGNPIIGGPAMTDIPITEIISLCGTIIATGTTVYKIVFHRVERLENNFNSSVSQIHDKLNALDTAIAVNTAILNQCLGGEHGKNGHRRNQKTT